MSPRRLVSPAAARNKGPIAGVLSRLLPTGGVLLEVGSGPGEHAVHLAATIPGLTVQPTDPTEAALESVRSWRDEPTTPSEVRPPVRLDVRDLPWRVPGAPFDAILAVNVLHVAPWEAAVALLAGAAEVLRPAGFLATYGPYQVGGVHTAPSNEAFDQSLRARDPSWGIRDIDALDAVAHEVGLRSAERHRMPANNFVLVFRKG